MMPYLGLDLGTGFAKLARCAAGDPARPATDPVVSIVHAALSYRGRYVAQIPPAGSGEPEPGTVRCDGFPMIFGTALSGHQVRAWGDRTADEVARVYLRSLLDPQDSGPGALSQGLVAAVPASRRTASVRGDADDAGAELHEMLDAIGCPPQRLVAAPIAALLWLRHRGPGLGDASQVVVIDIGAGAVDLTLCAVAGSRMRVVDAIRLTGAAALGETRRDETATTPGARPPVLTERLVTAMAAAAGAPGPRAGAEATPRWRAFESALDNAQARDRLEAVLQLATGARKRHGDTPALRFADLEVSAAQFIDAVQPLVRQTLTTLGGLLGRQHDPAWRRFGAGAAGRVVLIGGLSMLWPVRAALLEVLGIDPGQPGEAALIPANGDARGAVAAGAALLAAGLADPGDRYPHSLQLTVHQAVRGELIPGQLELAPAGTVDLDQAKTVYLTDGGADGGSQVVIRVPAARGPRAASRETPPISARIVPRDGDPIPATFRTAVPPPPGTYLVGVRGGPDGPAVMLRPTDGGEALAYPLAEPAVTLPDYSHGQEAR